MQTLTRDQIDAIFEDELNQENPHQSNIAIRLYKIAIPNYDKVKSINGWPTISENTSVYIFEKFIRFDKKFHPNVLNGGLWLNKGFSTDRTLEDWQISTENIRIET